MRITVCAILVLAGPALGQDKIFDNDSNDGMWFTPSNWDPDGLPGTGDWVLVSTVGAVTADDPIIIDALDVWTGLILESASLTVASEADITDITARGCCTTVFTTGGMTTLKGTVLFEKAVEFRGAGQTMLEGNSITFMDDLRAVSHDVRLKGTATGTSAGNIRPRQNGKFIVESTGIVNLVNGAEMSSDLGGSIEVIGKVGHVGTGTSTMTGLLQMLSGTIASDTGTFDLTGEYEIFGGNVTVTNFGTVRFAGAASGTLASTLMSGTGRVIIQNGNLSVGLSGQPMTVNLPSGAGFEPKGTVNIEGTVTSSGNLTLSGTNLQGGGSLTTTGDAGVSSATTFRIPFDNDGGTLILNSSLSLANILTNGAGGTLELRSGSSINTVSGAASSKLVNGGTLLLGSNLGTSVFTVNAIVDMQPDSTISVQSGHLRLKGGGAWSGGTVSLAYDRMFTLLGLGKTYSITGDVSIDGSGWFINGALGDNPTLDIDGTLTLNTNGALVSNFILGMLEGTGSLINNGTTTLNVSRCDAAVTNNGDMQLNGNIALGGAIVNTSSLIQGGVLNYENGSIVNSGVWTVIGSNKNHRQVAGGTLVNAGTYRVHNSQTIEVPFNNIGLVDVLDGATLTIQQPMNVSADGTLSLGTWITRGDGRIDFTTPPTKVAGTDTRIQGDGDSMEWLEDIIDIEDAEVTIDGDTCFNGPLEAKGALKVTQGDTEAAGDVSVEGNGSAEVGCGTSLGSDTQLDLGQPHSVLNDIQGVICPGRGTPPTLRAPIVNLHARLIPGGAGDIGTLAVDGDLVVHPTGRVIVDLDGAGGLASTDTVPVTGIATLGGTLEVHGANVTQGDEFLVVTATQIVGSFDAVDDSDSPLPLALVQDATSVRLIATCGADWNRDLLLNTSDFLAYLNDFTSAQAGNPVVFGNPDLAAPVGVLNTSDFLAYLNLFTAGCE